MTTASSGPTIGLDLGTSAAKGVLMAADGRILRTASRSMVYDRPAPDRVECDARQHWREIAGLIRELAAASSAPVRAVALSGASGNTLLCDAAGKPLTPIINWMDQRGAAAALPALQGLTPESVRRVTGWPCTGSFPLGHLAWLRAHNPELLDAAAHVGMNTDWLLFRLTGQWVMDYSTATTFHLQEQAARRWHRPYLERLGLRETQLPRLTASGVAAWALTPEAAATTGLTTATLGVTGAFDHPSAARAFNITRPGQLLLSCGTSWVGLLPWDDRDALVEAALLCDPFLCDAGGPWAGMFSVSTVGPMIDAYVASLSPPGTDRREQLKRFDTLAAEAPAGAGGVVIDLARPFSPVEAPAALVARAVMEAAARALLAHLERLCARGFIFKQAVMVGGAGNSPVWPGIVAEITGLELTVGTAHAGAAGAALLARRGAENFK